jgi:hypothetical protein
MGGDVCSDLERNGRLRLSSSFAIAVIVATLVATGLCAWWAARRWWDYLIVATFTVVLFLPVSQLVSDVFSSLPRWLWSEGPAGKDEGVLVSVAGTLLLSTVVAAAIVGLANRIAWRVRRDGRGE